MIAPIRKEIDVPCDPETAFRIFTTDIDRWWPKGRNSLSAGEGKVARQVAMEPRAGGALTELAHDGQRHHWGSVRTWSPPERLELLWHIARPESEATLVEVTFAPAGGGTRVTLVHSGWEAMGEGAADARERYDAGWDNVFERAFAAACKEAA